jgi:hypothetical protein
MTTPPSNPHNAPAHNRAPDDAQAQALLDLVEADAVAWEVRRASVHDPRMLALIEAMRADRSQLRALGSPGLSAAVPGDLLARVEAQLEREALLGLAHTEAEPLARRDIRRLPAQRKPSLLLSNPWFRGLSIAAVLAVSVGAGLLLLQSQQPGPRPITRGGPLADATTTGPADTTVALVKLPAPEPAADAPVPAGFTRTLVLVRGSTEPARLPTLLRAELERAGGFTGSSVGTLTLAPDAGRDLTLAIARDRARREATGARTTQPAQPVLVGAPAPTSPAPATADNAKPATPTFAGTGAPDRAPAGLALSFPQGADWQATLREALARAQAKASPTPAAGGASAPGRTPAPQAHIEIIQLAEPIKLPEAIDPAALLWWQLGAEQWGPRTVVPVVIEP